MDWFGLLGFSLDQKLKSNKIFHVIDENNTVTHSMIMKFFLSYTNKITLKKRIKNRMFIINYVEGTWIGHKLAHSTDLWLANLIKINAYHY